MQKVENLSFILLDKKELLLRCRVCLPAPLFHNSQMLLIATSQQEKEKKLIT